MIFIEKLPIEKIPVEIPIAKSNGINKQVNKQKPPHISRLAKNLSHIEMSAIKEMALLGREVPDAASLTWGVPSFATPEYIRKGIAEELFTDPDIGKYALPDGLAELRRLAARRHQSLTGIAPDPDSNILITSGNMQGMSILFHALIDSGDEIILTDPCFASHIQQIRMFGGKPVYWPLIEADNWRMDTESLADLITENSKALVLVSPSNPTGKIFSREELLRVGEIAKQHNLLIIIDDPYSHFSYENADKVFNLASEPSLAEHIVYAFTFSKAFAMSGWRLAYMVLPQALKQQLIKVQDSHVLCTPRISQVAGIIALREPSTHIDEFVTALARRRDLICERLDRLDEFFSYSRPEGAYYVFPRILAPHDNSREFAIRLLNEAKVIVTPGGAFGPSGEHHVRMAYCVDDDTINLAFDRLEAWFK